MLKNQKILGSFDDSSVTVFVCCKSGFYFEEMQTHVKMREPVRDLSRIIALFFI